jgi:hypothetical protein
MMDSVVLKSGFVATALLYGVAILLFGITEARTELAVFVLRSLLTLSVVGLGVVLVTAIRTYDRAPTTIRGYYATKHLLGVNFIVAIGCLVSGLIAAQPDKSLASVQGYEVWFVAGLVLLAVHQFVRGAYRIRIRWRTVDDVLQSISDTHVVTRRFSSKYDASFFVMTSIVLAVAARFLGSGSMALIYGAVFALILPFLLGSIVSQRQVLRRLLPHDAPLQERS